ncbi:hypothetical protein L7F22_049202 [Adiantum nelumboides]|nr:hypothetical protein [Adiantum nelumboides]
MAQVARCHSQVSSFTCCSSSICDSGRKRVWTFCSNSALCTSFNCSTKRHVKCTSVARTFSASASASASASSTVENSLLDTESNLIDALIGIQGRGRGIASAKLENISEAVRILESFGGVNEPTSSRLIEGTWRLMFTTRPGSASPIQRAFVGVDTFSVFQEITLRGTNDPRVCNIVKFSEAIGELKVEAAASIASGRRILFQFDKAAFSFKFFPFKVPYPVPFRLLGDEAKGWLETTYLSPSGDIRISKGNKVCLFEFFLHKA